MSKTITLFIVDRCSLDQSELDIVNDYLEKVIFQFIYWGRKTHRIGVYTGQGTGSIDQLISLQDATKSTWDTWQRIVPLANEESTSYDDIMSGVEEMTAYIKKLKFTQNVKWFGGSLPGFDQINYALGNRNIQFRAVMPDDDQNNTIDKIEDYRDREEIKSVAPVKMYEGPLTLGHPKDSQKIELAVKMFPFSRYTAPPATHAIVTKGAKSAAVKIGRDKVVDGSVIDAQLERGYLYGSQIIAVNAALDETARNVDFGDPAIEILGFVEVNPQDFIGETSVIEPNSLQALSFLTPIVKALIDENKAALARYVRGGKYPGIQMCFLEPFIDPDNDNYKLLMTPVAMAQDLHTMSFKDLAHPAPKNVPGGALIDEMDRVVDALDLGDEFNIEDLYVANPKTKRLTKYMMDVFCGRPVEISGEPVTDLGEPLPEATRNELAKLLDLKQVAKAKVNREQEDVIADEQELDLDELL